MVSQSTISLDQIFAQPPEPKGHGGCGSCGSGDAASKCGNGLEKIYPTTAVRFGYLRYIGEFSHAHDMKFTCGAKVVIQTRRGIEIGEQVSLTCGGCDKSVSRDQMKDWVDTCGRDSFVFDAGRILREATASDLAELAHMQQDGKRRLEFAQRVANRLNLPLKVVDCESLFGGERIIFFFMSEDRVDFRDMVRELAAEFHTRIEMRQVGARDEARLLADYETCGREVCCKVFLKTLRPVSMKMAKMQKATLDPSKVSGRCGRLKCCLRYEHITYEELEASLPRQGAFLRTAHGDGFVIKRQTLTQLVQIRQEDGAMVTVVVEDVLEVDGRVVPGKEEALQDLMAAREKRVAAAARAPERAPREPRGERRPRGERPAREERPAAPRPTRDRPKPESRPRPPAAEPEEAGGAPDDEFGTGLPGGEAGPSSARDEDRMDGGDAAADGPGDAADSQPREGDGGPSRGRRRRGRRRRRGGGGGGSEGGGSPPGGPAD
jgi:cell fate regulator YaaT (PSP1 superfamily)